MKQLAVVVRASVPNWMTVKHFKEFVDTAVRSEVGLRSGNVEFEHEEVDRDSISVATFTRKHGEKE